MSDNNIIDITPAIDARNPEAPFAPNQPRHANLFKQDDSEGDDPFGFNDTPGAESTSNADAPQDGQDRPGSEHDAVAMVLARDAQESLDMRTLIFDFGPFASLEKRVERVARESASPEIAEAMLAHFRQALHDSCFTDPGLSMAPHTINGIKARINTLDAAKRSFLEGPAHNLRMALSSIGAGQRLEVSSVFDGITKSIDDELTQWRSKKQEVTPPTFASMLFNLGSRLRGAEQTSALIGDARAKRNAQLVEALEQLQEAAMDARHNAGNPEWERANGPASAKLTKELSERIKTLTAGVEDQVDTRALRKGLDDVKGCLSDACDKACTEDFSDKLKAQLQDIQQFIESLMKMMDLLFRRTKSPEESSSPTITNRSPRPGA